MEQFVGQYQPEQDGSRQQFHFQNDLAFAYKTGSMHRHTTLGLAGQQSATVGSQLRSG